MTKSPASVGESVSEWRHSGNSGCDLRPPAHFKPDISYGSQKISVIGIRRRVESLDDFAGGESRRGFSHSLWGQSV